MQIFPLPNGVWIYFFVESIVQIISITTIKQTLTPAFIKKSIILYEIKNKHINKDKKESNI